MVCAQCFAASVKVSLMRRHPTETIGDTLAYQDCRSFLSLEFEFWQNCPPLEMDFNAVERSGSRLVVGILYRIECRCLPITCSLVASRFLSPIFPFSIPFAWPITYPYDMGHVGKIRNDNVRWTVSRCRSLTVTFSVWVSAPASFVEIHIISPCSTTWSTWFCVSLVPPSPEPDLRATLASYHGFKVTFPQLVLVTTVLWYISPSLSSFVSCIMASKIVSK